MFPQHDVSWYTIIRRLWYKKKREPVYFLYVLCVCLFPHIKMRITWHPVVKTVLTILFPVSWLFEVFLQVPAKNTWNRITRVTWQCTPTSLVTCRRSGFRKLFFDMRKQNYIKSRLPRILLAKTDNHLTGIGRTSNMSVLVRTKDPPLSLDSFRCNWYLRRKKCNSAAFLSVDEDKSNPRFSEKVSLWHDRKSAWPVYSLCAEVRIQWSCCQSFSRCPLTQ